MNQLVTNVRESRLKADYESIRRLVRTVPTISVEGAKGNPPDCYRFEIKVLSLRQDGTKITFADKHRFEVRLPLGYPRDPPYCRMLTPVFHPNIAPHAICVGDHWAAGAGLDALVLQIREMLAFQNYNVKSPLNGEAAKWVEEHSSMLPLDKELFALPDEPLPEQEIAVTFRGCANCHAPLGTIVFSCSAGHELCAECVSDCEMGHKLICLACGIIDCPECVRLALLGKQEG